MNVTRRQLVGAGLPPASRDTRIVASSCPVCAAKLNCAAAVSDLTASPSEGDLTLCASCGTVLSFDADLRQRMATQDELDSLGPEQRAAISRAQRVIESVRR